ncbi:ABC transporter substrate-binding protein [Acrocarpospora phusangensis]|uniref:ABC transporter substrate-binding protein n=1 Tax=Acrocarpospora phusangensis TaxID=1070424 RepID=A0A919UKB7_9ACTN|nr:ABC transporter substrate-binding protein [Acrocarpospora phusangensis]GIH24874.1 ABC transporter substrate-binding protein [Acrocarpospora phusangensis]
MKVTPALALSVLALVAVSCGDTGGSATSQAATVDFWYYQPTPQQADKVKRLAKDFETANPGLKIKLTEIPKDDYNTKIATALNGGNGPDAGYLDQPQMARFAGGRQIAAVPARTIDESAYYEGALETNRVSGTLYGVPLQQTTVVLFYNKDYVQTPPATWDQLVAESERVHRENPKVAGVALPKGDGFGAWIFPAFVASAGGTMVDENARKVTFNSPQGQEALGLWRTLLASSPRKITNTDQAFQKGLAAMTFSGPWDVLGIREQFPQLKFGTALLPKKLEDASTIGGENGVVFSTADNPDGAWKWLKFLSSADHNAEFADITGNFPVNRAAAAKSTLAGDQDMKIVIDQLQSARSRPALPEWIKVNDEFIAKAIEEGVDGGRSPAEALDTAAVRAAKALGW